MKTYHCKVFDSAGTYINTWNDATFQGFTKTINGGLGEAVVSLARPFDNFGEGEDVKLNNEVQIWLSDRDTPAEGTLIYSGYISAYNPYVNDKGQGVNVTLLGYVTKLSQDVYREPYTCLNFVAANNDYASAADDAAHDVTSALTVECWVKHTTAQDAGIIIHDLSAYKYLFYISTNSTSFNFIVVTASGEKVIKAERATGWNDGNWHHVACVWNKPQLRIFVDGKLMQEITGYNEDILAGDEGIVVGKFASSAYFNGQIMNIRISNTARRDDEIAMNWKRGGKLPADTGAVAVYHCDEGTGGTCDDETTNNKDLTLSTPDWLTAQQARSTIVKTAEDPATMLEEAITQYRANNPAAKLNYTAASIDATSTTRSYIFQSLFYDEVFGIIKDLSPANWYWYVGADNIVHFHLKPAAATHNFIYKRHIKSLNVFKNMEQIVNAYLFKGGANGLNLFKNYVDAASAALYERRVQKKSDSRVTDQTTADSWADSALDELAAPIVKTVVEIADNNYDPKCGYDIDSINPGDTCRFLNLDTVTSKTFGDNMLITRVDYAPEKVILEVESVVPDLATTLYLTQKRINERETTDVPPFYIE